MFSIIGTGRCGTFGIAQTLNSLKGVHCVHEKNPLHMEKIMEYHYGETNHNIIKNLITKTRSEKVGDNQYGESNQLFSLIIDPLREMFPMIKYVWVIRDGRDFVSSAMSKGWYHGHIQNSSNEGLGYWEKNRLNGFKTNSFSEQEWLRMTPFEKNCWYWSYINEHIEQQYNKGTSHSWFLLKFEEINLNFFKMARFLGIKQTFLPYAFKLNQTKGEKKGWENWSDKEKATFTHFCGDLMDKYYNEWKNTDGEWQTIRMFQPRIFLFYTNKIVVKLLRNL